MFEKIDYEIRLIDSDGCGSTACVCLVRKEANNKVVYCANIGDSRAVLSKSGKADRFSIDDKCDNPDEVAIYSAASCTTNAITPVLAVIEETLGVVKGHLETIHAYTNDQNLVDNMHKKYRRGRAAALNMVIVEKDNFPEIPSCFIFECVSSALVPIEYFFKGDK